MPELDKQEIFSPEMQEVMSEIPGRFLRWGLFLFFSIVLVIVGSSYFIKYPTVITAPVTVTTQNSPASLIAKSGGKIAKLFVHNEEIVGEKQPVAIIENPANYADIVLLISFLEKLSNSPDWQSTVNIKTFPKDLSLGEIQEDYSRFRTYWHQFHEYLKQSYLPAKLLLLQDQILKQVEYTSELMIQKGLFEQDLQLTINNFNRDSLLFAKGNHSISLNEFEQSKQTLLQKKSAFSSLRGTIKNNESATLKMRETLLDLKAQVEKETSQYKLDLDEALQLLLVSIDQWKEKFLIESPVRGKVTFTRFWNENQVIKSDETLASVIPDDGSRIIARAVVPIAGLGKARAGQEVIIKLSGFPYMEFGVIKGRIKYLSLVPAEGGYIAEIELINGMKSTYNKDICFVQEMDGTVDIISENSRLLFKFIKPLNILHTN